MRSSTRGESCLPPLPSSRLSLSLSLSLSLVVDGPSDVAARSPLLFLRISSGLCIGRLAFSASLHRRVYTHKVAKAIEYMVVDAMTEANEHFEIVEKAMDPKTFIQLDDSILKRIEHCNPANDDPKLRKAKAIVDRIRRRDLYKVSSKPAPTLPLLCCGNNGRKN